MTCLNYERFETMTTSRGLIIDKIGMAGSSLCALHCVICAFVPGLLTILGLEAFVSHQFEWGLTIFAVTFASFAMWVGFNKHQSKRVATLFLVGIVGLLLSRYLEAGSDHRGEPSYHSLSPEATNSQPSVTDQGKQGVGDLHLLGSLLGLSSGLIIASGHMLSIRKLACCTDKCIVSSADI